MSDPTKFLGVSQPISTAQPEEIDTKLTSDLVSCLETKNLFENEAEMQKRIDVLLKLTTMVKQFVKEITRQKFSQHDGDEHDYGGKLFTFGSYRLGVHNRGADIDTLCVVPRHVGREDFFGTFYNMLAADPDVTELHGVEDAFVPVIKLCYCGIELDILFARLALKEIPDDQSLLDDSLLKNLDDKSVRSLNGSRVAHEILNLIPDQATYVVVLRAIKFWATTHGVYSNVLGYFGGITWAILTARICQLYPNAAPAKLLQKFFYVFKQWQWPSPVFLKDSDSNRQETNVALKDMVWDPRIRISDRHHLMPIITPAYPEQNSTFNVTNSTKKIIVSELEDASAICEEVFLGKATWDKLFEEVNFFTKYKHYVAVLCCAKDSTDHLNYVGFVESKLRHLTANLEKHEAVLCAQVNTKQFKPLHLDRFPDVGYENPVSNVWFLGLDLDVNLAKTLDLTTEITQFMTNVQNLQTAARKYNDQMKIEVKYVPQKDIKFYLERNDFLKGRRYVKRKPALSRTASETEASVLPAAPEETKNSEEENTSMDTNAENIDQEKVQEGEEKTDSPAKPVFSFGAETTVYPEVTEAKMEVDTPTKAVNVLQENLNSLPKTDIPDEDIKSLKRPMDDGPLLEVPPEKQPRPDVTVA